MQSPVFLNGRFFSQSITGVQRFAAETTAAIDRLITSQEWPETTVLAPRMARWGAEDPRGISYQQLRLQKVGHTRGHVWEQAELPIAARGGILINLGNTAPLLTGSRQVVVIHDAGVFDTPESYSLQFRLWYRILQQRLVDAGAHVVTVSNFACSRITECLNVDPSSVAVMYEGADHILRVPADSGTLDRYGLTPGKFVLVVGAGAAHKNVAAIEDVAALLNRRGVVLAMVGSAEPSSVFRANSNTDCTGRRLGRVSDCELRALYESALCLLFPSRYEGFGLPPVEAMACGCPVLASRGGAVEEVCGGAALYFTTDDRRSMSDAIERILDEDNLADDLRIRGVARAATYRWDASARVLAGIVRLMQ